MVSQFILIHIPFYILPLYFLFYTIYRIIKHWSDGKEPARNSGGRLIAKMILTLLCSALEFIHVADYSPNIKYAKSDLIFRMGYFVLSGVSWICSAILVYFDYNRRLKSQKCGQRLFWILQFLSNCLIFIIDLVENEFKYSGENFYEFYLIQLVSFILVLLFGMVLSYYAIFRPDDFSVIKSEIEVDLDPRSQPSIDESLKESNDSELTFKVHYTGYKIKSIQNSSIIHFNINISINESVHTISRSLVEFELLDRSLREKFSRSDFPNLNFPDFSVTYLRNISIEERGQVLCKYLKNLCCSYFMTSELLDFLDIQNEYRQILISKHSQTIEEKVPGPESYPRAESALFHYYSPRFVANTVEQSIPYTQHLEWVVKVSIPSYRVDDTSQDIDYYVKCEIPSLGFEKIKPFKFADFANLHKNLEKTVSPATMAQFPSKNYSITLKHKDKNSIESRRAHLEYYLIQIFNDPAYMCKEALDFIGCDAEIEELYKHIPEFNYKIQEHMTWKGEISEDSTHFITYSIGIVKKFEGHEKDWKFVRRYREFDGLHKRITSRMGSPLLKHFLQAKGKPVKDTLLPGLPGKSLSPLSTSDEIESRKNGLETYIKELTTLPSVTCSFAFREFIEER